MTSSKKLKILICLLYYLPHRTGMQLYIQRISEALVQRGHEVTVLCVRHHPELPKREVINGVKVVRLWAPPIPISRGMIMPAYPFALFNLMRQHDVVSVHTPMLETALIGLVARLLRRQVIITHHGDLLLPKGMFNRFIQITMFLLYRMLAMQSPRIIAYTQDYAEHSYYLRPYLHKVQVIHPPITMPMPNPDHVQKLRAQWSHNGGPIIGYAGRFVQEKRPDLLIQSLDVINQKYPNARLVFVGEYDIPYENTWRLYQHIVQKYRDQLIFLGLHKDMQFMADFFSACDVLALTSDSECFALVQVEAMLSGTPVVMTNTPGGRVPVMKTGMGALAPVGDAQKIGETIVKVLDNRAAFVRSRAEVEKVFSFEETVAQYEAVFEEFARS